MAGIPSDPKALFQEVSAKLEEAQKSAGLDKAGEVVKILEEIKAKAQKGPGDIMDRLKESFQGFMDQINEAIKNPMAGGGAMAACAKCCVKKVIEKLYVLKEEAIKLFNKLAEAAGGILKPFSELGEGMGKVMESLSASMDGLMKVPQHVQELAGEISGLGDLAKVDLSSLKKALDLSGLGSSFDLLERLKGTLGPIMEKVKAVLDELTAFLAAAPGKVKDAFKIPVIGCCYKGPKPMHAILKQLEVVSTMDHYPLLDTLDKAKSGVANLDIAQVKKPMEDFASSATENVGALEKAQHAAKLATGGGGFLSAVASHFTG